MSSRVARKAAKQSLRCETEICLGRFVLLQGQAGADKIHHVARFNISQVTVHLYTAETQSTPSVPAISAESGCHLAKIVAIHYISPGFTQKCSFSAFLRLHPGQVSAPLR